jgi:hypothetical protein
MRHRSNETIMEISSMTEPLKDWIALASVAQSYRRKFDLARYIHSRSQRPALTAAAERVLDSLVEVIDTPIAEASRLRKAREAFMVLRKVMNAHIRAEIAQAAVPVIGPPRAPISRIIVSARRHQLPSSR